MSGERQAVERMGPSQVRKIFRQISDGPPPIVWHAWADAIVQYWERLMAAGSIDREQYLTVLDAGGTGSELALALPDLLRERLDTSACSGLRLNYMSWQTDSLPNQGCRGNPLVCVGWRSLEALRQGRYAVDRGNLYVADDQVSEEGQNGEVSPAESERVTHLLQHYAACCGRAEISLPLGAMDFFDALDSACCGRYLFIGADLAIVGEASLRARGASEPYLNLHALLLDRRKVGSPVWSSQLSEMDMVVYLVAGRNDELATAGLVGLLEQGHPVRSYAIAEAAACLANEQFLRLVPAMLDLTCHDPAVLLACLSVAVPAIRVNAATAQQWRHALRPTWSNYRMPREFEGLYRFVAALAALVGDWDLARECIRAGLKCYGDTSQDLTFLAYCEVSSGDVDHARQLLTTATLLAPEERSSRKVLADIGRRLSDAQRTYGYLAQLARDRELVLDPLHEDHAGMLSYQYRDHGIAAMTGLPILDTEAQARQWIKSQKNTGGLSAYAVMHRQWGFVGTVFLRHGISSAYFYFWIGCDFQGLGLGPRAAALALALAKQVGVQSVYTSVQSGNVRSCRALAGLGFVPLEIQADGIPQLIFLHKMLDACSSAGTDQAQGLRVLCQEIASPFTFPDRHG